MQSSNLVLFHAKYNQTISDKKNYFYFYFTFKILALLQCLLRARLIQAYYCILDFTNKLYHKTTSKSPFFLKIYPLYYSNFSLASYLLLKTTKKQVFTFSLVDLAKFQNSIKNLFTPLILLDTSLGLCNHNEAITIAHGGKILSILYRFAKQQKC